MNDCEHSNSYFIQSRLDGRDVIEKISAEDLRHGINSMGNLAFKNAYGEIGSYCPDCEVTFPVICGHGGSMWLCRQCAESIIENIGGKIMTENLPERTTEPSRVRDEDLDKFDNRGEVVPHKTPQDSFLTTIERLASRPDIDPEKIKQFMDMNERVLDRNAKQAFNDAMTRAQGGIDLVVATSDNLQTQSKYANLKTILVQIKPIYTAEGFSLMFYEGETTKENHKRICVDIMHKQGHTESRYGDFAIQTTGIAGKTMMTEIHGEGSAISYGRRYLTCMIFNVPTGDDDDAQINIEFINEKQLSTITDMINNLNADEVKFCEVMGVESLDKIPASDFNKAMKALRAKEKKLKEQT